MKKELSLQKVIIQHERWLRGDGGQRADLSKQDLSGVDLSGINLTRANLFRANLHTARLYKTRLVRAHLCEANLSGANLTYANLSEANLARAKLFDVDLSGADLTRANLSEADLTDAILTDIRIDNDLFKTFYFPEHRAILIGDHIAIGCKTYSIQYWLDNYKIIGERYYYTRKQIEKYGEFIQECAKLKKDTKNEKRNE